MTLPKPLTRQLSLLSGAITIFLVTLVTFSFVENFLSADNIIIMARQAAIIVVVSFGASLVILHRGIDLSVGSMVGLSALVMAYLVQVQTSDRGLEAAIKLSQALGLNVGAWLFFVFYALAALGAALTGLLCGFINGILVARYQMPAFVATFGTLGVYRGMVWAFTGQNPYGRFEPQFHQWLYLDNPIYGVPNLVWIALGIFALMHAVTRWTHYGNRLYAVGGNPEGARLSGVDILWYRCSAYLWSGLLAGVAGVLLAAKLNLADPNGAEFYEFDAIAIAVIGGSSFRGGKGSMIGTVIGATTISMLRDGLTLADVSPAWQEIAVGGFLVLAFALEKVRFTDRVVRALGGRPA